jgi:transposase
MKTATKKQSIIGIDISKLTLDVYFPGEQATRENETRVSNNAEGFARLGQWLKARGATPSETVLVSEHTGRYGEQLLRWSSENGWPHAVVKTTALQKVSDEHHRKSDGYDARKLAEYGRRFNDKLRLTKPPKAAVKQLKRLQAERRKMVDQRAALKAKRSEAAYHDADMDNLLAMWGEQIALLTRHIDQIEQRIQELIDEDPALNERNQTMRTAPGMGKVLGPLWLSLHAGQQTLDPRKVASHFGFAPHCYSSGSSVSKPDRSSGFGNSEIRKVAHQAALSVANNYPHYQAYYQKKEAKGKDHKLIINNIINKLIHLYCAMWNNRAEYDPNYIQKMKEQWKKSA